MTGPAVAISGLVKRYGDHAAVDGLDLEIEEGAFHGLLGPNGAGKTTTIGTLTGLVRPTAGTVKVFGADAWADPAAARRLVGVCPQEPNFDDFLGLEQILAYHAGYFGHKYGPSLAKARETLRFFDLYDYRKKRTSTLSGGMKRRLLLARAMMHDPRLLILDEPTAGVDVELRRSLWEHVRRLNEEQGVTVLLTTHYLEEAEALCDDITVIDHGRVIERGSPDDLRDRYGSRKITITLGGEADLSAHGFHREGDVWTHESPHATDRLTVALTAAAKAGADVIDVQVDRSRLEDVFVQLTRRKR